MALEALARRKAGSGPGPPPPRGPAKKPATVVVVDSSEEEDDEDDDEDDEDDDEEGDDADGQSVDEWGGAEESAGAEEAMQRCRALAAELRTVRAPNGLPPRLPRPDCLGAGPSAARFVLRPRRWAAQRWGTGSRWRTTAWRARACAWCRWRR